MAEDNRNPYDMSLWDISDTTIKVPQAQEIPVATNRSKHERVEKIHRDNLSKIYSDVSGIPKWALPYVMNFSGGVANIIGEGLEFVEGFAENIAGYSREEQIADGKNPLSIFLEDYYDFTNAFDTKYYDDSGKVLDFQELMQRGEWGKAATVASEQAAESAPSIIMSVINPLLGGAVMGISTAGGQYKDDLVNRPDQSLDAVIKNSLWAGGSEMITEVVGGYAFRGINALGAGKTLKVVNDFTSNYILRLVGRTLGSGIAEATTEALNSAIQDSGDMLIYDDEVTTKQFVKNVVNSVGPAFILGGLGGGAGSIRPRDNQQLYKFIAPRQWKQEYLNIGKNIHEANLDLENAPENKKDVFKQRIKKLVEERTKHENNLFDIFDNLSKTELKRYAQNIDKANQNMDIIGNNKYSKSAQDAARQENLKYIESNLKILGRKYTDADIALEQDLGAILKASEIIEERLKKVKGINRDDLDIKVLTNQQEIDDAAKLAGKGVKTSDGVFIANNNGKATIYINKNIASAAEATNVLGHELLHYMISKKFKTDNKSMKPLVGELKSYLQQNNPEIAARVQERIDEHYTDDNGNIKDGALEEYLNVFSDLIDKQKIDLKDSNSKGLMGGVKDVMAGFGFGNIQLNNAQDVVSFLKTYNKNINRKGLLGKLMGTKVLDVGLTSDLLVKGQDKKPVKKRSRSTVNLDQGEGDLSQRIDSYTKGATTKAEFQKAGGAFDNVYSGILEGKFDRVFGEGITQEQKDIQRQELADRLLNFDPAKTPELSKWMYGGKGKGGNIGFAGLEAKKTLAKQGEKTKRETTIDTKEAKELEDVPTKIVEQATKGPRVLSDFNLDLQDGLVDSEALAEVESLLEENPSNLKEKLDNVVKKHLTKRLKDQVGKIQKIKGEVVVSPEYESFIRDEFTEIVKNLDIQTIRKLPWFDRTKVGTEDVKGTSKITGKVTNFRKGIFINKANKPKYLKYYTQGGFTTLRERQSALLSRIVDRKVDAVVDKYIEQNSTNIDAVTLAKLNSLTRTAELVENELKTFDTVKFSITKKVAKEIRKEFESIRENTTRKGKIYVGYRNPFTGEKQTFTDLGKMWEQTFANYFYKMNIDGLDILSQVATEEGGMADFVFKYFGQQEQHEIKAGLMGVFMGSTLFQGYNHATGEITLANDVHNNLLTPKIKREIKKAHKKRVDQWNTEIKKLNKETKENNLKRPIYKEISYDITPGSPQFVPYEVYHNKDLGVKSLFSVESNEKPIENHYTSKNVNSISILNTPLGNVSFSLGGSMLRLPRLKMKTLIDFTYRNPGSQKRTIDGYKVKMQVVRIGIQFKAQEILNKKDELKDMTNQEVFKNEILPAKASKNINNTQVFNKAVKLSRTSQKAKGITILDFDDTLATSKSLVRYTAPGQTVVYNASPKSIKELGKRSGVIYLATDKKEADAYAKSNRGEVREFVIDNANVVNENVVLKEMKDQGIDVSEGLLYEMIDSRFPDFYIGKKNVDKVFNALRKKGIKAFRYEDGSQISSKTTKSIAVIDKSAISEPGTLNAEEYARSYQDLQEQGYTFDFSEFNKVVKGKTAPLFQKALKLQGKFGPENMFVLTARPPQAQKAIFDFLKANGLNIPLENITGLGNSTSEAKALWIADKVGEGYNDFYFADDALQNVQAVDNMLEQFDVKRKVQQAKVKFSKTMNDEFNDILEDVTGIESVKRFDFIKARKRGASKGKFRFFVPPSHEDFVGLLYNFMGKGRKGDVHRDFLEKALVRPLNRANREYDTARQSVATDYKNLNKQMPDVKKMLLKKTPDGDFIYQDAIRVYLWDKHGYDIPGLSPIDQKNLVDLVKSDPMLQSYADAINTISRQDAYVDPTDGWDSGDIRMDLDDATGRIGRAQFFEEFIANADIIFSKENLNKIEAGFGKGVREALEDMLYRIKTGRNKPTGQNGMVNSLMNWVNGSVGSVMFFNMRSALLQQMSLVNYINFADNNIFAAAKAFANQKQYWEDWSFIFNSDMLKQRRGGIQTDVNGAELAAEMRKSKNPHRFLISKLLQLGFLPTQIGDNIAIATGGATYYRNRINTYLKQGLSQKEAEAKAFTDFQDITQSTQQSARPDMVSQQQASLIGKIILNFQNVTSQFNRLGKKAFQDIYNRRITKPNTTQMQSDISNAARITYYFAVQNAIFYTLQTALFAMLFDDDEEDVNNLFLKKQERLINGSIDSVLRGTGIGGAVISTLKNVAIAFARQRDVNYNPDESAVVVEALNFSPVIGIKARKIVNAEKTLNYNKKVIDEMSDFDIDNPQWSAVTNYIEGFTNAPLNRLYNKTQNIRQGFNNEHEAWERALMFLGWSQYNLNLENTKIENIKKDIKAKNKKPRKTKRKNPNLKINI